MSSQTIQVQRIIDSQAAKLLQYIVTVIMLPLACWTGARVLDRMDRFETVLNSIQNDKSVMQNDIQNLKTLVPKREAQIAELTNKVNALEGKNDFYEFRINNLESKAKK